MLLCRRRPVPPPLLPPMPTPPPCWRDSDGRFPASEPRLPRQLRFQSGGTTMDPVDPVDPRLVEIGKSTYLR